jgi:DNA-binding NarL/FixJ family response regulator
MRSTTIAVEFDDLDEIAIERALIGDGIALAQLTRVEQLEVVRRLTEQGQSIADIAARLATSTATVSRRRASLCACA